MKYLVLPLLLIAFVHICFAQKKTVYKKSVQKKSAQKQTADSIDWFKGTWYGIKSFTGGRLGIRVLVRIEVDSTKNTNFYGHFIYMYPKDTLSRLIKTFNGKIEDNRITIYGSKELYLLDPRSRSFWSNCSGCPETASMHVADTALVFKIVTTNCGDSCSGETVFLRDAHHIDSVTLARIKKTFMLNKSPDIAKSNSTQKNKKTKASNTQTSPSADSVAKTIAANQIQDSIAATYLKQFMPQAALQSDANKTNPSVANTNLVNTDTNKKSTASAANETKTKVAGTTTNDASMQKSNSANGNMPKELSPDNKANSNAKGNDALPIVTGATGSSQTKKNKKTATTSLSDTTKIVQSTIVANNKIAVDAIDNNQTAVSTHTTNEPNKDSLNQTSTEKSAAVVNVNSEHISSKNDSLKQTATALMNDSSLQQKINRTTNLVNEYQVTSSHIQLELFDNGEIDSDVVSVLHNGKLVINNAVLTYKPITFTVDASPANRHHEFILIAENEGALPPNTALLRITAGSKQYKLTVSTSKTRNAKIAIDYTGD